MGLLGSMVTKGINTSSSGLKAYDLNSKDLFHITRESPLEIHISRDEKNKRLGCRRWRLFFLHL